MASLGDDKICKLIVISPEAETILGDDQICNLIFISSAAETDIVYISEIALSSKNFQLFLNLDPCHLRVEHLMHSTLQLQCKKLMSEL